jgi:ABC-type amino acid transport substrate-binding protein
MRKTLASAVLIAAGTALAAFGALAQQSDAAGADRVLRVCEDPNNLPFSNRGGEGFENKIAELLARELGWTLEYTWFPQRMGFIRNTLRARDPDSKRFKCDLVIGVPLGFELASTTKPYYRSTYALAYVKGRGLDSVTAPERLLQLDPAKLKSLKLGVVGRTPPADWLLKHHLFDQAFSYQTQSGDPERYPGEIIEKDLVSDRCRVRMGTNRGLLREEDDIGRSRRRAVPAGSRHTDGLSHRYGRALRRARVERANRAAH